MKMILFLFSLSTITHAFATNPTVKYKEVKKNLYLSTRYKAVLNTSPLFLFLEC